LFDFSSLTTTWWFTLVWVCWRFLSNLFCLFSSLISFLSVVSNSDAIISVSEVVKKNKLFYSILTRRKCSFTFVFALIFTFFALSFTKFLRRHIRYIKTREVENASKAGRNMKIYGHMCLRVYNYIIDIWLRVHERYRYWKWSARVVSLLKVCTSGIATESEVHEWYRYWKWSARVVSLLMRVNKCYEKHEYI
jgi:hypothetical protein